MGSGSSGGPPRLPRLGIESNFLLGPNKRAVIDAAQGLRPYADQPEALRRLVSQSFWDGLSKAERLHLAAIYNTMEKHRLWQHVTKVVGVKEKPEAHAHVLCLPGSHAVEGSSGGFLFETGDHRTLYDDIFKADFGTDGAAESFMHKGQTSTRESTSGQVTHEVAAPDGLHISLGPGNRFDAHMDKVSPTNPAQAGRTQMDLHRGWLHHRHEVHGDVVRDAHRMMADWVDKKTGIEMPLVDVDLAGFAGGPTLDQPRIPMPEDRNNPAAPIMVDVTLRGPVGKD
jgi:hypothetical protein